MCFLQGQRASGGLSRDSGWVLDLHPKKDQKSSCVVCIWEISIWKNPSSGSFSGCWFFSAQMSAYFRRAMKLASSTPCDSPRQNNELYSVLYFGASTLQKRIFPFQQEVFSVAWLCTVYVLCIQIFIYMYTCIYRIICAYIITYSLEQKYPGIYRYLDMMICMCLHLHVKKLPI